MTPLTLLAAARDRARVRLELQPHARCVLAARPAGVLHAYTGPLTPSGRWIPRAGRTACRVHTRTLGVVTLSMVGRRRVCGRCTARLAHSPVVDGAGHPTRAQLAAAYDGVTAFDLALDAWRAETVADVERVEWLVLLLVGYPACATQPVMSPGGKVTGPLDEHTAKARRRLGVTRDPLTPGLRAAADENQLLGQHAMKQRRHDGWREREDRIERLGYVNATA